MSARAKNCFDAKEMEAPVSISALARIGLRESGKRVTKVTISDNVLLAGEVDTFSAKRVSNDEGGESLVLNHLVDVGFDPSRTRVDGGLVEIAQRESSVRM